MAPDPDPKPPETVTVTPQGGPYDSLWDIAEQLFENGALWGGIYQANRDLLDDPGALRPGMRLRLPMEIYPGHIRSAAGGFDTEKHDLGEFVNAVAAELNAIGNFWGGGKEGTMFFKGEGGGMGYEAVTSQIIEGVDVLQDAHHAIPKRLRLMADRVQVADWDNVTTVLSALPAPDPDKRIWGAG
ncbi:LysM peptidoglycan-binding domain-containing protein [Nonomuraea sp. NEAU-A123]|uniref:LysM peptidoglycan-binding domain-containing protein n=1 Tax=Nonomuraea sp. NEAU-A123 TaxID=2839649 RepID=UPI001BE46414|nr:LysM peptidoglycan-binding domain-containing protein [Nonomuraea sp. NEAU-A123]MBT2232096.1 LysM peptidoglycan-binding domain-containing protein [Nonomuraea sp. NEAU-A123]